MTPPAKPAHTPWSLKYDGSISCGGPQSMTLDERKANNAFIVEAVNTHAALVAQVETLRGALDLIARFIEISTRVPKSERGYEKNNLITEARAFIAATAKVTVP